MKMKIRDRRDSERNDWSDQGGTSQPIPLRIALLDEIKYYNSEKHVKI